MCAPNASAPPLRALVVDDDPAALRLLSAMLGSAGYDVRTASDGVEALESIKTECPDFVITDWEMPRLDGHALCRRIRAADLPQYVYLLFLTSCTASASVVAGLQAGADDFLCKPFDKEELLARLRAGERILALERRLSRLAYTDALTGVPTQRVFHEHLHKEFVRSQRYRLPLSCVMLDLDYFKRINDSFGHSAGDVVLKATARLLVESCRASDFVCRHGGEEFCALLPETDEKAAALWAERMCEALAQLRLTFDGKEVRVTASFGVSHRLDDTPGPTVLIEQADQALLVAKQSGRNRVVTYSALQGPARLNVETGATDPLHGLAARDLMTSPVACLRHDDTISQAAAFFCRFRILSAPVFDAAGQLVGIISEKDVLSTTLSGEAWSRNVEQAMSRHVVCYEEETPVRKIYDFLSRVAIRRVIIVKDGAPTGVIGRSNLLRWMHHWLRVAGPAAERLPDANAQPPTREQMHLLADRLADQAAALRDRLADESAELVPTIVHGASHVQEQVEELLSSVSLLAAQRSEETGTLAQVT